MNGHRAARRYGDTIACAACALQWDNNDPDPPECIKPMVQPTHVKSFSELFAAMGIDEPVNKV